MFLLGDTLHAMKRLVADSAASVRRNRKFNVGFES
jgi:hypothetical protein